MNRGLTMYVLFLCTILLGVRCSGAHVHLCFDGKDPAISVQFEDGLESGPLAEATSTHHDTDIAISGNLGGKLPKIDLPVLALLFSAVFIALNLLGTPPLARARSRRVHNRPAFYFQPPLRGPPV